MVSFAKETKTMQYELLDTYDTKSVFVYRRSGVSGQYGSLSFTGVFTPEKAETLKRFPFADSLRDPLGALKARITKETRMENVDDVSVSSDNTWATFRSGDTIYVTKLDLKEKPYALTKGTYARIRPY